MVFCKVIFILEDPVDQVIYRWIESWKIVCITGEDPF